MEYIAKYFEGSYDKTLLFISKVGMTFIPGFLLIFAANKQMFMELEAWKLLPLSIALSFMFAVVVAGSMGLAYISYGHLTHKTLQPIKGDMLSLIAFAAATVTTGIFISLLQLGDMHAYGGLFTHAVIAASMCVGTGVLIPLFLVLPISKRAFITWFLVGLAIGALVLGATVYQVQGLRL